MNDTLPGYTVLDGPPTIPDYLTLRREAGMSRKTEEQAAAGIGGAWAAIHAIHDESGDTVGMGRVIGDGGWYFHVIDMAVLPPHQGRGIGSAVLRALLDRIHRDAPPGAYVSLMADEPGRPLYERHGFADPAPRTIGMSLSMDRGAHD
ncbi:MULTISPECIES: GNAT family N-acetyltransferase [Kocuria]|uniref:GNAT family N-acetyltransferase n=1 Tax=Kocuria TaxID=57493 RepID=UPI0019CF899A|nr:MULTISPECIES: GNAT family N-acetyltransferase [Kocuria]MBN6812256.1 GNAT family N-acetyltransferase [Kocuria indica]MBN6843867.1 GNAT family N-acetyltransferase [Kocuria indica]